jgi:hypothetical protein
VTPSDLFLFVLAGAAGLALGLLLLGVVLGVAFVVGSALLRRFVKG